MTERIRNSFLDDLLGLISIRSVNGDNKGIKECFRFIMTIAERFGFRSKLCANGMVLEVYPHKMPIIPKIGIITHVDTVPFEESKWTHNPLGEIFEDRVYGRGVLDDKVGVIYSLYAMKELEDKIKPDWKIIIGSCEEGSWSDMRSYIREGNTIPGFMITIDGDGIQNGCRGTLNLEMVFKPDVEKPSIKDFQTPYGVTNIVPDYVSLQVGYSFKSIRGKACHSSVPENGENAIVKAFEENEEVFQKEYPGFYEFMINYRYLPNALFIEEGGRIITNQEAPGTIAIPTMVKMEKGNIILRVNVRLSPSILSKRELYYAMTRARTTYDCMIIVKEMILPSYIHLDNEELKLMQDAYEDVIGLRPKVRIALGTGYNAAFQNAAIFGPRFDEEDELESDLCHCPDESRSIEDIEKFYEILVRYLKKSLGA